jgi:hypothetical protein
MSSDNKDLELPDENNWFKASPWKQFKMYNENDDGGSHYYQAELVAVHRAIYILKQLEPGQTITYHDLMTRSVEYANQFHGIGAKYRDTSPRIELLADYGVIAFDGDPEDWENTKVRLTAKGFLARPEEWYEDKGKIKERAYVCDSMMYNYNRTPLPGDDSFFSELKNMGNEPTVEDEEFIKELRAINGDDVSFLRELEKME